MTLRDEACYEELAESLREFTSRNRIVEVVNTGNWGDSLIHAGQAAFLKDIGITPFARISIMDWKSKAPWKPHVWKRVVLSKTLARHVIFTGCGAFREFYNRPKQLASAAQSFSRAFIMPSSIPFVPDFDPERTVFWRRDKVESLEAMPQAQFCHDMAFYLQPKPRKAVKKVAAMFRVDVEKASFELPQNNVDLSNEGNHDTDHEGFLDRIGEFEVIHTNRLHVGIAGALLGREVHLYESRTRKLESIFETSLKPFYKNVFCHSTPPDPSLFM